VGAFVRSSDAGAEVRVAQALASCWRLPLVTVSLLLASRLTVVRAYHYTVGFSINALLVAGFN
jgi:hypothetical protein